MDCSSNKNNWQERTQYLEILQGKFSSRSTSSIPGYGYKHGRKYTSKKGSERAELLR
jgi:hypothetical protein